jgi:hypothetical protein
VLEPTKARLADPNAVPYFAWDLGQTVTQLRTTLDSGTTAERDEIIVRLLREANTRDVWLFIDWDDIDDAWDRVEHRLGRARGVWQLMRRRRHGHVRSADPAGLGVSDADPAHGVDR